MKPTHGLVPFTGVMPFEITLDHIGPMTTNVFDNALMLEVLAGPDGLDPRQYLQNDFSFDYTTDLKFMKKGLKVGILKEGFNTPKSEKCVDECVRKAALQFEKLGAEVSEVSIPEHKLGFLAAFGVCVEGF
mmetsp:Transcript_59723/g.129635  ORF Transcript_59723/g.129635 Transcript_59723/m.129635 type:complete len:131 (+) Transcript_59723:655-1047(+)